ncbi:MAG: ABC transporter ATP-binding protein [Candidatus Kerfeldbacteria bacterium]|nr:ABC transporter ATP-binding protein [Candidatus Kerfeldbacteria bacterium]
MSLISLNKISKTFTLEGVDVRALVDVDLMIEPGEFMAVMGPSGSGKSTLMNVIGLLDRPSTGAYELDGRPVSLKMGDRALAKMRGTVIGFIFQSFNLLPNLNVLQNVLLPSAYVQVTGHPTSRAKQLLDEVGLSHRLRHRPTQLSGGEKQRVAIARALMNDPRVVLADEPTGNLDSKSGEEIISILERLNHKGTTLLLVTHNEDLAKRARRIIHMKDGRLV